MSEHEVEGLTKKIDGLFDTLDSEIKKFLDEILKREQRITDQLKHNKTENASEEEELAEIKKSKRKIKKLELDAIRDAIKNAMEMKKKEEKS
ncbi:MAG: hypothetical protein IJT14_00665 [Rickettsiales bacterium]|nr:hypothetical protein [Rickettsiales bacterium]